MGKGEAVQATVLLFDIDGTLVTTAGAGKRALQRAFDARHGRSDALHELRLDGMTDHAIIRAGLARIQVPFSLAVVQALVTSYLELLSQEIALVPDGRYRVHAGARPLLERVSRLAHVAVGLGTGNVRAGARIKLQRVGLDSFFSFGGFGCDAEERADLIRRGAERGAASLGHEITACRVVVIGDTPKDVAAAKAIGAECVGVGTGSFSPAELRASGADHAFHHLGAPGALEAVLGPMGATP